MATISTEIAEDCGTHRMRPRRQIADFLIKGCGLRNLQGGKLQESIRAVLDEIDLQRLRDAYPCTSFRDRAEMHRSVQELYLNGDAVDYLEFGVFQGESMRQWTRLNKHDDSRFFGFDSFEGLPEDWRAGQRKGHFDVRGTVPRIDDPRVKFVKGWFENTIPPFAHDFSAKNRLLLHVDCDLYGSAMLALVHFAPFMSKGSLLIFDEFYDRENEFKAFMDWQAIYRKRFRIIAEMGNYGKICVELL
jgi:O-methyltransferase